MKNIFTIVLIIFVLSACKDGSDSTTIGNPLVSLYIAPENMGSMSAHEKVSSFAVSELRLCFKRLRFKQETEVSNPDPDLDEDNVDINLGLVTIPASGGLLTSVNVPSGVYTRIEFDLKKDCDSSFITPSVYVDNGNDSGIPFETDDSITIKFEGFINIQNDLNLNLYFTKILAAMDTVTSDSEIKTLLEDSLNNGSYD